MAEDLKSFFVKKRSNNNYSVQMRCLGKQNRSCSLWVGWLCSVPRCCSQGKMLPCRAPKLQALGGNAPTWVQICLKMRAWSQSCGSGFPLTVDTSWLESKPRREGLSWGKVLKSGKPVKILKCDQAHMKNFGVKFVSSCWWAPSVDKRLAEAWGRIS